MTDLEPETTLRHAAGIWPLIHAERAALAADLADLTVEQWAAPSLCTGLTVREVLAHLIAGASLNPVRWLAGVIRCRFDFDKQVAMRLAEQLGATPAETIDRFRSVLTSTTKPPVPTLAMLGETIVHAQDIRLPLSIPHDYPIGTLTRLAEYYQGSDLPVLTKTRIRGLRLVATDGPFNTGSGPLVSGTTLALIMAMAGRGAYWDELQGDGSATLRDGRLRCMGEGRDSWRDGAGGYGAAAGLAERRARGEGAHARAGRGRAGLLGRGAAGAVGPRDRWQ